VDAAVASGNVPPELQGELTDATVELQNGVNCEAPPEEEENAEEKGENGKGEKKGHDKDEGLTLETTTEEED
jgi:hypothetical protein